MTVQSDGEERMLGSLSDNPTTDELLGLLYAGLREKAEAGKLRTLVICTDGYSTDATTGARTDAILVRIEDEEQRPVTCILPYKKRTGLFGRGYEYGELIAAPLEPQVFVRE